MVNYVDDFEPSSLVVQQMKLYYDAMLDTQATPTWE
jgi:hypothetical protein